MGEGARVKVESEFCQSRYLTVEAEKIKARADKFFFTA